MQPPQRTHTHTPPAEDAHMHLPPQQQTPTQTKFHIPLTSFKSLHLCSPLKKLRVKLRLAVRSPGPPPTEATTSLLLRWKLSTRMPASERTCMPPVEGIQGLGRGSREHDPGLSTIPPHQHHHPPNHDTDPSRSKKDKA